MFKLTVESDHVECQMRVLAVASILRRPPKRRSERDLDSLQYGYRLLKSYKLGMVSDQTVLDALNHAKAVLFSDPPVSIEAATTNMQEMLQCWVSATNPSVALDTIPDYTRTQQFFDVLHAKLQ